MHPPDGPLERLHSPKCKSLFPYSSTLCCGFHLLPLRARANRSRVATRAGTLSPCRINPSSLGGATLWVTRIHFRKRLILSFSPNNWTGICLKVYSF